MLHCRFSDPVLSGRSGGTISYKSWWLMFLPLFCLLAVACSPCAGWALDPRRWWVVTRPTWQHAGAATWSTAASCSDTLAATDLMDTLQ